MRPVLQLEPSDFVGKHEESDSLRGGGKKTACEVGSGALRARSLSGGNNLNHPPGWIGRESEQEQLKSARWRGLCIWETPKIHEYRIFAGLD